MARTSHLLILLALLGLAGASRARSRARFRFSKSERRALRRACGYPLFGPASRQAEHERR